MVLKNSCSRLIIAPLRRFPIRLLGVIDYFPSRFSQPLPERLVKKTVFIQFAELSIHWLVHGQGKNVGGQVLSHRDVGCADNRLGDVWIKIPEQGRQLSAARSKSRNRWMDVHGRILVFSSEQQKAQLVGVDKKGDGLEIVVLPVFQRPDHNVSVLYPVRFLIIKPLLHQLWRGLEPFSLSQGLGEIITGCEFNAAHPVTAAPATGITLG